MGRGRFSAATNLGLGHLLERNSCRTEATVERMERIVTGSSPQRGGRKTGHVNNGDTPVRTNLSDWAKNDMPAKSHHFNCKRPLAVHMADL